MEALKAFVGHSFIDDDKEVVRRFTEHFTGLSKAGVFGFAWDHAEEAQPVPLSDKVKGKMEGKSIFIGICTKKEPVIRFEAIKGDVGGWGVVSKESLVWKTSDWIIQEIGYAVGRKMTTIIFLEVGVREPGGLHGTVEYIPFIRGKESDSFDKFLQMLSTLIPKDTGTLVAEGKPAEAVVEKKDGDPGALIPGTDWDQDKYDRAAVRAILKHDADALATIDTAFKASRLSHGARDHLGIETGIFQVTL